MRGKPLAFCSEEESYRDWQRGCGGEPPGAESEASETHDKDGRGYPPAEAV
jgi:hypothetical protein